MTSKEAFKIAGHIMLDCSYERMEIWDLDSGKRLDIAELYEEDRVLKIYIERKEP